MLDRASLERLAESPEHNDPLLNVALAEEGDAGVLLALAGCGAVGPEALEIIAARIAEEGDEVGRDTTGEEVPASPAGDLDRCLIMHPNASGSVVDGVLARHADDPFFVLAAGAHPRATERGLTCAAEWPSSSPLHDRPWIALLRRERVSTALFGAWAHGHELLREAAGRLASDPELLAELAADVSRRVRRAVASNLRAVKERERLAREDPAIEVRMRAGASAGMGGEAWDRARPFDTSLQIMRQGGAMGGDVRDALVSAGARLDEEGALLAAKFLEHDALLTLVAKATASEEDLATPFATGVGVGLGLRPAAGGMGADDPASLTMQVVHLLTKGASTAPRLTGKARMASWIAECLNRSQIVGSMDFGRELPPGAFASDRMVLSRSIARRRARLDPSSLLEAPSVPVSIVELCWQNPAIADADAVAIAARVAPPPRKDRELPEDELDLAPAARALAVLERAVLAAIARAPVSPRAALAAIALDTRRSRYVLTAMPTWKGIMTGSRLARVLRSHAGALSAASKTPSAGGAANGGARPAAVAHWTNRRLSEMEAAIAIAIGDLTAAELLQRLVSGKLALQDGVALAAGIEARTAIDGPSPFTPIVDYATARRTRDPAALALWMLLERLDRVRAPSLIASALDGLAESRSVVAPAVCEALATLERQSPGRLEEVHAQTARGRATIASAIARAYRALGGMRDEG